MPDANEAEVAAELNVPEADLEAAAQSVTKVLTAEQKAIQVEQTAGERIAREQERIREAQQAVEDEKQKAFGDSEALGYHHKTWAGHDVLQCGYCPWDVIDSAEFNYEERMQEHLKAAHPQRATMPITYDRLGNAIASEG